MAKWHFFYGDGREPSDETIKSLPSSPPWRQFAKLTPKQQEKEQQRWQELRDNNQDAHKKGKNFRIHTEKKGRKQELTEEAKELLDAVNAAIYLRRPLLVQGNPGSGKTSLAHAIAYELKLGPVLTWPITARSTLQDSLYRYDAIARLQDKEPKPISEYIKLGPVGTAFLPSEYPRVLLIDEIDKSDINLPNDLLNLLEEGFFEIPELIREAKTTEEKEFSLRTADGDLEAIIDQGKVICSAFPIIVMTSNGERDFPPAFWRRCLRVTMPNPQAEALKTIVKAHFEDGENKETTIPFQRIEPQLDTLIKEFLANDSRATDQLLNTIYILANIDEKNADNIQRIKDLLFKSLDEDA